MKAEIKFMELWKDVFIWILLEANTETKPESQWGGGNRQEKEGRQ